MASAEWQEIYRSYAPDELDTEIASLKKEQSTLVSQSVGNKNYTQDVAAIRDKLHAAIRVKNERANSSASGNPAVGFADFSQN